jgi:hypothetical protein
MFLSRSTMRFLGFGAAVLTAGCAYKGTVQPDRRDASGHAGSGGIGGAGGAGGGGGARLDGGGPIAGRDGGPIIIITGGSTGTDGGHVTLDANCGTKTQSAKMIPPDMMLVMDRSLSMTNDINDRQCAGATGNNGNCGANSKWELMVPPLNQVIAATDTTVNWGMFYLGDEPSPQCGVATAPVVPIAAMNAGAVTASLTGNLFNGDVGTPTRRVIQGAVSYLRGLADMNPKYLLLATDGQPNCATASGLNMDDTAGTQQAVADALTAGIPTFVVGIGNTNAAASLNQLAVAGGRPQMGGATSYYQVNDATALAAALGTIVGQAASCTFNIGKAPDGTTTKGLGVFGDGSPIPMDATDGWSFTDTTMTSIIIKGPTCDRVLSGMIHDVTVAFVCDVT